VSAQQPGAGQPGAAAPYGQNGSAPAPPWETPVPISDIESKEQRAAALREETLKLAREQLGHAMDGVTRGMPLAVIDQVNTRAARIVAGQLEAEVREARAPKAVVKSAAWLNAQTFAPVSFVVPGVIPEGVSEIAGKPKSGKSWLMYSIGLAAASGSPMLGALPGDGRPRPVFYLALEDSDRRIKDRGAQLGYPRLPEHFYYCTSAHMDQALRLMLEFLETYQKFRPVALVDTWGKLVPPAMQGESAYQRDYRVGGKLKEIADARPGRWLITRIRRRKGRAAARRAPPTAGLGNLRQAAMRTRTRAEHRWAVMCEADHVSVVVVERRRDGKLHPPGGTLPDKDRWRAVNLAHRLVHRDHLSIRAAQRVLLEEHGIRRSFGSVQHDLKAFTCRECEDEP
jgi:hypothetical protein